MSVSIKYGSGVSALDPKVLRFVEALSRIHGPVSIRQETGGLHAYFPSPLRLQLDGRKELISMHGAVNLDKYFGTGKWEGRLGSYDNDDCAMCMKSGKKISMLDILDYPPIQSRGIPDAQSVVSVTAVDNELKLVTDHLGRRVPGEPGQCTFLKDLPADHPAVRYVVDRGYDLAVLHDMLEASFCHVELPEGTLKRYYRKGPDGWKDTPQNRLILFGRQHGSCIGWQARILQQAHQGYTYFLHPYRHEWVPVEYAGPDKTKVIRPDYGDDWKRITRYRSADAMSRNEVLFCYDAALRWNDMMAARHPGWVRRIVLTEGPLDAAKFGPPAVGATGKFVSPEQARLIAAGAQEAVSIMDNDAGGADAEDYFRQTVTFIATRSLRPPAHRKDLGECDKNEIAYLRYLALGIQ